MSDKYFDCSFGTYSGKQRWVVKHPKYREITVRAPDDAAAIMAAGKFLGEDWTRLSFYTNCEVRKI